MSRVRVEPVAVPLTPRLEREAAAWRRGEHRPGGRLALERPVSEGARDAALLLLADRPTSSTRPLAPAEPVERTEEEDAEDAKQESVARRSPLVALGATLYSF